MNTKNIVIGAGPSGIGAGLSLAKDCLILEKSTSVGGFSKSLEINGAIFDYGGHSFHTPHPEVRDLVFNSLDMYEQKRNAKCFVDGEIIPYPFQKNFRELKNTNIIKECSDGLLNLESNISWNVSPSETKVCAVVDPPITRIFGIFSFEE